MVPMPLLPLLYPLVGFLATFVVFRVSDAGRAFDQLSRAGRVPGIPAVFDTNRAALEIISVGSVLVVLAVLIGVGAARGRWPDGLRACGAVVGAVVSVQVLKAVLPYVDPWGGRGVLWGGGSFPSGHAVTASSVTLAVLWISPDRWRRVLVGPLVAWTAVATAATVTLGWHHPSDVIGSFFVAVFWHQLMTRTQPADRRLRTLVPRPSLARRRPAVAMLVPAIWWAAASGVVLLSAVAGVLAGEAHHGRRGSLAYLAGLCAVLGGAGALTIYGSWRKVRT